MIASIAEPILRVPLWQLDRGPADVYDVDFRGVDLGEVFYDYDCRIWRVLGRSDVSVGRGRTFESARAAAAWLAGPRPYTAAGRVTR
jgi:hypothetical protein